MFLLICSAQRWVLAHQLADVADIRIIEEHQPIRPYLNTSHCQRYRRLDLSIDHFHIVNLTRTNSAVRCQSRPTNRSSIKHQRTAWYNSTRPIWITTTIPVLSIPWCRRPHRHQAVFHLAFRRQALVCLPLLHDLFVRYLLQVIILSPRSNTQFSFWSLYTDSIYLVNDSVVLSLRNEEKKNASMSVC